MLIKKKCLWVFFVASLIFFITPALAENPGLPMTHLGKSLASIWGIFLQILIQTLASVRDWVLPSVLKISFD